MKFYKHYKNKAYRYHGIAKHSETLEDYVIYECLYPNELATMWIRPQKMFEENILINSLLKPRFEKIELKIQEFEDISSQVSQIQSLCFDILGSESKSLLDKLKDPIKFSLLLAIVESKTVAFKLGYELNSECFYSWLGGVHKDFRGLGIAKDLAHSQEEWCRRNNYKKIQTKIQNRWKSMLILNLKQGYKIVGFEPGLEDQEKIILEKIL